VFSIKLASPSLSSDDDIKKFHPYNNLIAPMEFECREFEFTIEVVLSL
jgi:hypothetical protein